MTEKELEMIVRDTHLSFNCIECKKYWTEFLVYWKDLGKEGDVHLYCPHCSPYRPKRDF